MTDMQTTLNYFRKINHEFNHLQNKKITHFKSRVSFKKHNRVDDKKKVIHFYKKAKEYCLKNDYETTLKYCDKCLKIDSRFYKTYNLKANISLKNNDIISALKFYNKSLSYKQNNYNALFGKTQILSELFEKNYQNFSPKEWDFKLFEVLNFYNRSAVYNVEIYLLKAEFLNKLQLYDLAVEAYDEFLDKTSIYHEKYFRCCLDKALTLKDADYYQKAIDLYNELLNQDYKSLEIYFHLGELYFISANYQESYEMFEEYIHYDKDNIDALMYLAQSAIELFEFDKALDYYDRILGIDNEFYNASLFKFELLCKLNRFEEALDTCADIPSDEIPKCYADLCDYAFSYLGKDYYSGIYSVVKNKDDEIPYEFFYIRNGKFKLFRAYNMSYLKYFVERIGHIWCLI